MKSCPNCDASNFDSAKFCNECGEALDAALPAAPAPAPGPDLKTHRSGPAPLDAARLARSLTHRSEGLSALNNRRKADIMFVLDCTESMKGEINAIKEAVANFVDTIDSDGVRARVGLIEFRDRLIGEEHRVLSFGDSIFTSDPAAFRRETKGLNAAGGGDIPESSLDAVMLALKQPFDESASKVVVLITDAPPHVPDKESRSVDAVARAIREAGVQQLYLVIRTQEPQSQVYLELLEGTRGLAFELGKGDDFSSRAEDFKRTLMNLGKTISSATR